jgi:hypothetical protein
MTKHRRIQPGDRRQNRQKRWYTVIGRSGERAYATGKPVYEIEFDSGYRTTATSQDMHRGKIRDRGAPSVCGVGITGWEIENPSQHPLYHTWHGMIERCHSDAEKHHNYRDVSVCDQWLRFNLFVKDAEELPGYDMDRILAGELTIDKDKLGPLTGPRTYGPDTCCWLTNAEQAAYRRPHRRTNAPQCPYRGVHWTACCWLARPQINGVRELIDSFRDPLEAARRIMAMVPGYYLPEERERILADIEATKFGRKDLLGLGEEAA